MKKQLLYVAYLRVSTAKQTKAKRTKQSEGLSFNDQLNTINNYIRSNGGNLIHSFTEAKSGKRADRVTLAQAIAYCKEHNAVLITSHLDRLTRDAGFWHTLQTHGVTITCCDVPPGQPLVAGMMALIADHQGKSISNKVKSALERLKEQGVELGNPDIAKHARKGGIARGAIKAAEAKLNNQQAISLINEYRNEQGYNFEAIAQRLNKHKVLTSTGKQWCKSSVYITYTRYAN